ncbi:hypothetical protein AB0H36_47755 [Kribbella sp. NPDC050820]|uniref:hypothetical protein n=1 Tax=Kribbella sp. NPDC050820 TaxID=3155408 RepID=UPI0033FEEF5F
MRTQRWTARRQRLEQLAATWARPVATDPGHQRSRRGNGLVGGPAGRDGRAEGLVVKGAATRYRPGRRDAWLKVNSVGGGGVRFSHPDRILRGQAAGRCWAMVRDRCRARVGVLVETCHQPSMSGWCGLGGTPRPTAGSGDAGLDLDDGSAILSPT